MLLTTEKQQIKVLNQLCEKLFGVLATNVIGSKNQVVEHLRAALILAMQSGITSASSCSQILIT